MDAIRSFNPLARQDQLQCRTVRLLLPAGSTIALQITTCTPVVAHLDRTTHHLHETETAIESESESDIIIADHDHRNQDAARSEEMDTDTPIADHRTETLKSTVLVVGEEDMFLHPELDMERVAVDMFRLPEMTGRASGMRMKREQVEIGEEVMPLIDMLSVRETESAIAIETEKGGTRKRHNRNVLSKTTAQENTSLGKRERQSQVKKWHSSLRWT